MMSAVTDDSPGLRIPSPVALLRWFLALGEELARSPATLSRARELLDGLGELPVQLDRVVRSVEDVTAPLSGSLEDVAVALTEIRDRLEHLDTVILHLRDTVFAVVAAIPGGRRALDRLPPPPQAATRAQEDPGRSMPGGEGYDAPPCSETRSTT